MLHSEIPQSETPHSENPRVSFMGQLYEVDRHWGAFDPGRGRICDVTCDSDDNVYVLMRYDRAIGEQGPAVVVLNSEGQVLRQFGEAEVFDAHLLTCGHDGLIYIVDRDAHQVISFSPEGQEVRRYGARHSPLAPFNHPTDVVLSRSGELLVSDGYCASKLHRFSVEGDYLGAVGTHGIGAGQWVAPHALWELSDGRLALVDRDSNRLLILAEDGLTTLTEVAFLQKPMAVWGDAQDRIWVTDLTPSLTCLSAEGVVLGRGRPMLNGAHGIFGDSKGRIYLAEGNPNRVLCMQPVCVISKDKSNV